MDENTSRVRGTVWVYWGHPLPDPPGRTLPILVAIIAPGEPLPPNDTREANAFDGKDDGPCLDLRLAWDISQLPPRAFVRRP